MPTLARHNSQFFLTMFLALGQNPDWCTAPMTVTLVTAHTRRMLVPAVIQVCLKKCVMIVTCSDFCSQLCLLLLVLSSSVVLNNCHHRAISPHNVYIHMFVSICCSLHTVSTMLVSLFVQSHCCRFSFPTVPTSVSLNTPVTGTANSGEVKYYNFPFHSSGITFRLDVFQGSVVAYASYSTDAPNPQRGYNWRVQATIYDDLFFSPAPGSTVYVALQGTLSSNSFRVGVVAQDFTTTGGCIIL